MSGYMPLHEVSKASRTASSVLGLVSTVRIENGMRGGFQPCVGGVLVGPGNKSERDENL